MKRLPRKAKITMVPLAAPTAASDRNAVPMSRP